MNMSKKRTSSKKSLPVSSVPLGGLSACGVFMRKSLAWGTGLLGFFIVVSFFSGTFDTAQAKATLLLCGAGALISWWLSLLTEEKRFFLTKQNAVWYAAFLGYYAFTLLSMAWAPFRTEGWGEFARFGVYFGLTLMALSQFRLFSVRVVSRCIVWAAWIACGYGFLQVLDGFFPGVDFMPSRAFFGKRIFSTLANPNFFGDFIVFSFFVVWAEFLRMRQKSLLVLMGLSAVDLFFTQSKGAWLAFGAVMAVGVTAYINYFPSRLAAYRKRVNVAVACVLAGVVVLAGVYTLKRVDSVGFRLYTWGSALAMVQDSPVLGTGVGSFKTIYPAYKKPQIFFIENAHNTETQHAENELLEQWATGGTLGLILFLWMIIFVFFAVHKRLSRLEGEARPGHYWLWGYGCALAGMLLHNQVDVSIRFASSGVFFALFLGIVTALSRPETAASSVSYAAAGDGPAPAPAVKAGVAVWVLRVLVWVSVATVCVVLISRFYSVIQVMSGASLGEVFVKAASWLVFLAAVLGVVFVTWRAAVLYTRPAAIALLLCVPAAGYWGFNTFMADHYYGIATGFAARNQYDGALAYFQKAIAANPLNTAYRQYRGTMLASRLDLSKTFNAQKGDQSAPATDYERVLRDFDAVKKASPNHALLNQAYGEFYYTAALKYSDMASRAADLAQYNKYKEQALKNMDLAQARFKYSLLLDPVNPSTYIFLIQSAILQRQPDEARAWIAAYRRGPQGVTQPHWLEKMRSDPRINALEQRVDAAFGKK